MIDKLKEELKTLQDYKKVATDFVRSAQVDLDGYDKKIAELEKEIAEQSLPKLIHGRCAITKGGIPYITIVTKKDAILYCGDGSELNALAINYKNLAGDTSFNAFDDLKALQEDVKEFKMKCHNAIVTNGTIEVGSAIDPPELAYIFLRSEGDECVSIHMTVDEFSLFTQNCRKKDATMKRRFSK